MSKFKIGDKVKPVIGNPIGVVSCVDSSDDGGFIGIDGSPCHYYAERFELVSELTPHVHQEVIIAYANGEKIQHFCDHMGEWFEIKSPAFHPDIKYRVKPQKTEKELKIEELKETIDDLQKQINELED